MVEHSEFPWGPETVPGLLTPVGVAGWIIAGVLALLLMNALRVPDGGKRRKLPSKEISDTYEMILIAARHALSQDDYGILAGANLLRRVIETRLGRTLKLGGEVGKLLKAISEAMGEKDKSKEKDKGHGGGHGGHSGGHSARGGAGSTLAAVGNNVHGPSITVNVGVAEKPEAHDAAHGDGHGHDDHVDHDDHHDDHDKPLSLEDQLLAVRRAVRDFEIWWSNRAGRIGDMEGALKDFTDPEPLDETTKTILKKNESK